MPPTTRRHTVSGSISLPFRGTFHLSLTVLVHYRSIKVFSLASWSSQIPTEFHVLRCTQVVIRRLLDFMYRAITLYGGSFQTSSTKLLLSLWTVRNPIPKRYGLGSFPFARRYLGNRLFFLFLRVLRCFSSPGLSSYTYLFSI